jgi:hypothetical protein
MRLHAANNFKKHLNACRRAQCFMCEGDLDNMPSVSHTDGMHYHLGGTRCTAFQFQGRPGRKPTGRYYKQVKKARAARA